MSLNPSEDLLHTVDSVKRIEQRAMQQMGLTSCDFMRQAASAILTELLDEFGRPEGLTIFCGSGSNAGDGYMLAELAANDAIPVQVFELGAVDTLSPSVAQARLAALKSPAQLSVYSQSMQISAGIVIDALIGTGLRGSLKELYRQAIRQINDCDFPVVAIDVPSGLDGDTGNVSDDAVIADLTITFIAPKQGLFTGRGPVCCGVVVWHSLNVPPEAYGAQPPSVYRMKLPALLEQLPLRPRDAHKAQFGHVMVIGGDIGFGGAAIMAAQASVRAGAGLVSMATRPEHVPPMLARQPEVMAVGVVSGQELQPLLKRSNVLVIGPGLGQSAWSEQLLQKAFDTRLPMVVDADALNILASGRVVSDPAKAQWIMTPHPGEAARLLDISVREVEANRFAAVRKLHEKYSAVVVLKGVGSLVTCDTLGGVSVCPYGNPGMASGGMGDILSGVIGALLAQGLTLHGAAELGCCLHSYAADMASQQYGEHGLAATDLLTFIRGQLNNRDFLDELDE